VTARQLSEAAAERVIADTMARLMTHQRKGRTMREIVTRDGGPSPCEANVRVAIDQGRIPASKAAEWLEKYRHADYETVTQALLSKPPTRAAAPQQRQSVSEAAWEEYARATWVNPPRGYTRSVV
jgi:hypothetical protein